MEGERNGQRRTLELADDDPRCATMKQRPFFATHTRDWLRVLVHVRDVMKHITSVYLPSFHMCFGWDFRVAFLVVRL